MKKKCQFQAQIESSHIPSPDPDDHTQPTGEAEASSNTVPYSRNSERIFNISEPKETVFLSHVKCTFQTPQADPEKTTVGAQQPNSNVTSNYPHSQGYPMLLHTQYITFNRSYFLHRTNLILTHTSIIQH